jgi:hypothetical protein
MKPLMGLCAVLWLLAGNAAAEPKPKLAVLDLKAETKLEAGTIKALNELLLTEVHNTNLYEVLGASDISSMLNLEERKMMVSGCTDDSCLAEIGGALGVSLLLVGNVGGVGDKYLISLKLLDVVHAKVLKRTTDMVERNDTNLIAGIKRVVALVCRPPGDQTPVVEPREPIEPVIGISEEAPSSTNWPAWITLGSAVLVAGVGGAMGGLAQKDQGDMSDLVRGSTEWRDLKDSAETKALVADVMFGLAGAAAITSLILFLVIDDEEEAVSAGVSVTPSGAAVSFGMHF